MKSYQTLKEQTENESLTAETNPRRRHKVAKDMGQCMTTRTNDSWQANESVHVRPSPPIDYAVHDGNL